MKAIKQIGFATFCLIASQKALGQRNIAVDTTITSFQGEDYRKDTLVLRNVEYDYTLNPIIQWVNSEGLVVFSKDSIYGYKGYPRFR